MALSKRTYLSCIRRLIGLILLATSLSPTLLAQNQQPVSRDLLDLYATTNGMTKEAEFSSVIDFCSQVVADRRRTRTDVDYASQLLAWAANKRGEKRSDQAGELAKRGRTEEAESSDQAATEDFLLAIKHDPKRWRARHNLAVSMALQGKVVPAISELSKVIADNPKYPNAYFNRAELYFRLQEYDQAIADYSVAIQLDPQDVQSMTGRARSLLLINQSEEALQDYRRAIQIAPKDAVILVDYADACHSLYRWNEALDGYRRCLLIDPENERSIRNMAWLQATCPDAKFRKPNAALELLGQIPQERIENSSHALDVLAACYAATGQYSKAVATAERAMDVCQGPELSDIEARVFLYRDSRAYLQESPEIPVAPTRTAKTVSQPIGTGVQK